jgi:hypothetical protein
MNWLARLRAEVGALRGRTGRDFQLRLDTARIYVLTQAEFANSLRTDFDSIAMDDLPPFEEQVAHVSQYASAAAIDMIARAGATEAFLVGDAPVKRDSAAIGASARMAAFGTKQSFSARRRSARETPRYSVSIRQSGIEGAGLGVFVDGKVDAGSVLTLYPGVTYKPSQVIHMPDYPDVSKNNGYLMWRYDGIIVDGSPAAVSNVLAMNCMGRQSTPELSRYAAGHLVNHPPRGGSPNALQYAITLDVRALPQSLHYLLPILPFEVVRKHQYSRMNAGDGDDEAFQKTEQSDTAESAWMDAERKLLAKISRHGFISRTLAALEDVVIRQRVAGAASDTRRSHIPVHAVLESLALIATRDIVDEEVLINYRFNPASPLLPNWYEDCNPSESKRRWLQDGFWAAS